MPCFYRYVHGLYTTSLEAGGAWIFKGLSIVAQASLGPFAWERRPAVSVPADSGTCYDRPPEELPAKIRQRLGSDVLQLQRTHETFQKILQHDRLHLALPLPGVTAGAVVKHAFAVFESTLERHKPMTYKFGYTHCPHFRWCNAKFGYAHAVQKYERMDILYVSADPVGPAFLESALIHHYKGHLI